MHSGKMSNQFSRWRNSVYKFGVDCIYSFGDFKILTFCVAFAYRHGYLHCTCTESMANLLLEWKLSTYLDLWGQFVCSVSNFQRCSFSNSGCLLVKSCMLRLFRAIFCPKFGFFMRPVKGSPIIPYWESPTLICLFTIQLVMINIEYWWILPLKGLFEPKLCKSHQKMAKNFYFYLGKWGWNEKFCIWTPKRHILVQTTLYSWSLFGCCMVTHSH